MSVRIIIDSSSDMCPEVKERMIVVPLTVSFGDKEYVDGVTISCQEFYEKLIESDELPRTSQAPPAAFAAVFEEVVNAGDTAVVVTLSSKLSGTCQSAMIAAQDYPGKIFVVDSLSVTIAAGILAERGLYLADEGRTAKEIAEQLTAEREKLCLVAMLDTLEYLKKGGRISKAVAFAGGVLNIKPVVGIKEGEIAILGKARGSKQANNLLITEIQKTGGVDFSKPHMMGYTGLSDALLQKYISDSKALWEADAGELRVTVVGSSIGTHAGPGAVAAAFFAL